MQRSARGFLLRNTYISCLVVTYFRLCLRLRRCRFFCRIFDEESWKVYICRLGQACYMPSQIFCSSILSPCNLWRAQIVNFLIMPVCAVFFDFWYYISLLVRIFKITAACSYSTSIIQRTIVIERLRKSIHQILILVQWYGHYWRRQFQDIIETVMSLYLWRICFYYCDLLYVRGEIRIENKLQLFLHA
jgi:hypothetical protein